MKGGWLRSSWLEGYASSCRGSGRHWTSCFCAEGKEPFFGGQGSCLSVSSSEGMANACRALESVDGEDWGTYALPLPCVGASQSVWVETCVLERVFDDIWEMGICVCRVIPCAWETASACLSGMDSCVGLYDVEENRKMNQNLRSREDDNCVSSARTVSLGMKFLDDRCHCHCQIYACLSEGQTQLVSPVRSQSSRRHCACLVKMVSSGGKGCFASGGFFCVGKVIVCAGVSVSWGEFFCVYGGKGCDGAWEIWTSCGSVIPRAWGTCFVSAYHVTVNGVSCRYCDYESCGVFDRHLS
eukprot:GHVO01066969.1.p2 GENE.GHVO01066969.1~~GHVO01066969.1.p2  ORF type:complete len:298 (+),score=24.88 GHVO01066969.1:272-1165(+)